MLIILSPAKSLDFSFQGKISNYTLPEFIAKAEKLIKVLMKYDEAEIKNLMGISMDLAKLNYNRYRSWTIEHNSDNALQAIFAYSGDVYEGLNVKDFSESELNFAQKHIRIISGLYGILRPLDLIMPYRLEMATKLSFDKYKNLYEYWSNDVTTTIKNQMNENRFKVLLNLASVEYSKAVNFKALTGIEIITPVFKEYRNNKLEIVSFYAKKARGLMSRYIVKNSITDVSEIKNFNYEGYSFVEQWSDSNNWVFAR